MTSTRTSLWAVAPGDRPREKLERLGPGGLTDAELVALVLGSGLRGVNVLDSAASLLDRVGGVHELMMMTVSELKALMGVGVATAGRVVAVAELWRRAHDPLPGAVLQHPNDVVAVVRAFVAIRSAPAPAPVAGAVAPVPSFVPEAPELSAAPGSTGSTAVVTTRGADDVAALLPAPAVSTESGVATYVVVADSELRVRVVVPLARDDRESIRSLVPRVLHEVLYRGGAAFALAELHPHAVDDDTDLRALRDVLKLASTTVGLRYLSTVVLTPDDWREVD